MCTPPLGYEKGVLLQWVPLGLQSKQEMAGGHRNHPNVLQQLKCFH